MKEALQQELKMDRDQVNSSIIVPSSAPSYEETPFMKLGHKIWEIRHVGDIIDIDKAELTSSMVQWEDKNFKARKLIVKKPGCYYISALNEDNALKRYCKVMGLSFSK
jgi:hypothetical protein